jgi:hypothetical protein
LDLAKIRNQRLINQGFQMNFNDYINNSELRRLKSVSNGEHKKSTLLGIAYDCGFNSATLTDF